MFYQTCLSPQVKRWAIITYKHEIYKSLPSPPAKLRILPMLANNPQKTKTKPPPQCATPHECHSQPQVPRNQQKHPMKQAHPWRKKSMIERNLTKAISFYSFVLISLAYSPAFRKHQTGP